MACVLKQPPTGAYPGCLVTGLGGVRYTAPEVSFQRAKLAPDSQARGTDGFRGGLPRIFRAKMDRLSIDMGPCGADWGTASVIELTSALDWTLSGHSTIGQRRLILSEF